MPTDEEVMAICKIVHLALRRNYPELTIEEVEEMLDFANCMTAVSEVLNVAGFKSAEPGKT